MLLVSVSCRGLREIHGRRLHGLEYRNGTGIFTSLIFFPTLNPGNSLAGLSQTGPYIHLDISTMDCVAQVLA
jgi:hypothetical protein